MQLKDCKITKYIVGQLNEVLVDQNINNGVSVLIPLNMTMLKMNGLLNDYFDLKKRLYFCINMLVDDLIDKPILSIIEYENKKMFKRVEITCNDDQQLAIYTYAMEGLVYLSQKNIVYKSYHKMK